nr:EOG090X0DEG [Scapholeberis mucronata]
MISMLLLSCIVVSATAFRSHQESMLSDAYLRGIMSHLGDKMLAEAAGSEGYLDYPIPRFYEDMMSPFSRNKFSSFCITVSESLKTTTPSSSGKTENVLPAYCNPPNPCPIGYTADDGCLEEFENTAAFSREYQSSQDCMCDTEHMFDCPASSLNNKNAKNRATAKMVDTAIRKIMSDFQSENPYLQGDKLPIAAKKGNRVVA